MRRHSTIILFSIILSIIVLYQFLNKSKSEGPTVQADKVVVFKSKRQMHLLSEGRIIKTYAISLGDNPKGHKVKEGDEKTPEGVYTLDWRNSKSSCYKSIHISYPNSKDKSAAKKLNVAPGGNIMIHGLHPSISWLGKWHTNKDWTNGCIAVTNEEMEETWKSVKFGTLIEIKE